MTFGPHAFTSEDWIVRCGSKGNVSFDSFLFGF